MSPTLIPGRISEKKDFSRNDLHTNHSTSNLLDKKLYLFFCVRNDKAFFFSLSILCVREETAAEVSTFSFIPLCTLTPRHCLVSSV